VLLILYLLSVGDGYDKKMRDKYKS